MKRILILTTCLLSGLMAASITGDQDDALPSNSASAVSLNAQVSAAAPLTDFTVPGLWGDKDISDWQKQNPGFVGLKALAFKMFDSFAGPYNFLGTFDNCPRSAKGIASFVQCTELESLGFGHFFNVTAYGGAVKKVISQFSNLQSLSLGNFDISGTPEIEERDRRELQSTVGEFFKALPKLISVSFVLASSVGQYTKELIGKWPDPAFKSYKFDNVGGYTLITLSR